MEAPHNISHYYITTAILALHNIDNVMCFFSTLCDKKVLSVTSDPWNIQYNS